MIKQGPFNKMINIQAWSRTRVAKISNKISFYKVMINKVNFDPCPVWKRGWPGHNMVQWQDWMKEMTRNAFCSNYIQIQCPYFLHIKQPKFTEIKNCQLLKKTNLHWCQNKTTFNLSLGLHQKKNLKNQLLFLWQV